MNSSPTRWLAGTAIALTALLSATASSATTDPNLPPPGPERTGTCGGLDVTHFVVPGGVVFNGDDFPGDPDQVIQGTGGDDIINGGAGDDTICGAGGTDVIHGDDDDDHVYGEGLTGLVVPGADPLDLRDNDDQLYGDLGSDHIFGGEDPDVIEGGNDNDYIYGGVGDDFFRCGAGFDRAYGDDGFDSLLQFHSCNVFVQ